MRKWGTAAVAALVMPLLCATASAGAVTLQNQVPNGNFTVPNIASVDRPGTPLDAQAADEFTVPAGQVWTIEAVEMYGFAAGPTPNIDAANAVIYASSGTAPGQPLFTQSGIPPVGGNCAAGNCDFSIPLSGAPKLQPGEYWISGQAVMDTGIWRWAITPPQFTYGKPAVWQNPGDGYATGCTTYRTLLECDAVTPADGRDLYLTLEGQLIDSRFGLGNFESNGRKIKLNATFPGQGMVTLTGKKVRKVRKSVGAGNTKLPIKPTKGAQRKLSRGKKVRLSMNVTFTATGGAPFVQKATVNVRPNRAGPAATLRLAD